MALKIQLFQASFRVNIINHPIFTTKFWFLKVHNNNNYYFEYSAQNWYMSEQDQHQFDLIIIVIIDLTARYLYKRPVKP